MKKQEDQLKRKTFPLRLTKFELIHLRDLFSVMLPPELKKTLSQALAESEERVLVEARLWLKVAKACKEADLPMDDDAPDFICAAASTPAIGVFKLAHEPQEDVEEEASDDVFSSGDEEEDS